MNLKQSLNIQPGVTALIGGGGKTTCMYALARELSKTARVIVCTTTHILRPEHLPTVLEPTEKDISAALEKSSCICVGCEDGRSGKLTDCGLSYTKLAALADFVLVEADGAHRKPLKAHASYEPVIPPEANNIICLVGISGIGEPIAEAVHRPERYAERLGVGSDTIVTPDLEAKFLELENLHTRVLINQVETAEQEKWARELAKNLHCPTCMGALQKEKLKCLY